MLGTFSLKMLNKCWVNVRVKIGYAVNHVGYFWINVGVKIGYDVSHG